MELKEVEAFYWSATLHSFSKAAIRLDTSQPTISARVASLERRLSHYLFDRSGREAKLTPKGLEMLAWAERILSLQQQAIHAMCGGIGTEGIVRVGTSETIVHTWLPDFIRAFEVKFPRLSLELTVDTTPNLRDGLAGQEIDLAFLLGPVPDPSIQSRTLSNYKLSFVAAPRLGFLGRPVTIEDLADVTIITYGRRTRPTIALADLFRSSGMTPPRMITSASLSANIRLAVSGAGVAILPPALIQDEIASERLEVIKTDIVMDPLKFTISYCKALSNPVLEAAAELAIRIAQTTYQEN
ncbi:LysR family transcriptional regulator [Microvirga sp. P5_D2]